MPSEELRALLKARHERHRAVASDDAARATPAVCAACKQPTYQHELCPETGMYHDMERKRIIGGSVVQGRRISSSALMEAIERTRVKWVASRTQLVKADAQSLNIFQSFVAGMDWQLQRYGILYGQYDASTCTVAVHAVYEPEQRGNAHTFGYADDPRQTNADAVASYLGLRRVGAICTHPLRDTEVMVLSAREALLCAREQSRFGDECILLTIGPTHATATTTATRDKTDYMTAGSGSGGGGGGGTGNNNNRDTNNNNDQEGGGGGSRSGSKGNAGNNNNTDKDTGSGGSGEGRSEVVVTCQAWQMSPQCVNLYRLGVLHEPPSLVDPREARLVHSTIDLEEAQQVNDDKGHASVITKAPSKCVDARWFTSYIAVQSFDSPIVRGVFMRIARPGMSPPTMQNLKSYMNSVKRRGETFAQKIADFHVLLFLAEVFSLRDDMPVLAAIAVSKKMTRQAQHYEEVLNEYMK